MKLKNLMAVVVKASASPFRTHTTKSEKFTPHVAPGLEIGLATIGGRGDEIVVHYRPKSR